MLRGTRLARIVDTMMRDQTRLLPVIHVVKASSRLTTVRCMLALARTYVDVSSCARVHTFGTTSPYLSTSSISPIGIIAIDVGM